VREYSRSTCQFYKGSVNSQRTAAVRQ
jgi:hypothetical protein